MQTARVTRGLVVLALGIGVALGCSSSTESAARNGRGGSGTSERVGTVGLRLQPVTGITVSSVHYTVTQGNPSAPMAPLIVSEGNLPTPGVASSVSFGIPLPVGTGYYLSLTGVSAELNDDVTCTGSYGPFAVAPNVSTAMSLRLTCVDYTKGSATGSVEVETDACPRLIVDYAVAEPSIVGVGDSIAVFSGAHDLDNAAEVITYSWEIVDPANAGLGQFTPANARDSSFRCTGSGNSQRLRVTAQNHECRKSLDTVVSCVHDLSYCGDGVVELAAGETCDPGVGPSHPADPTCPADCTKICGDGNPEGDEQCDPLPLDPRVCNPPGSLNECHIHSGECGDGFVDGLEACDTLGNLGPSGQPLPSGAVCATNCASIIVPELCGDGSVAGTEECDAGGLARCCSTLCETLCSPGCLECEQAGDCFASSDNCLGTLRPFTPAEQKTCTDVMQCIQDSNCLDGTGSLGKCYCGTLGTAACGAAPFDLTQPGAPNGPCAAIMQQGHPGVTSNSAILGGLTSKARPAGAAGQRLNCQKTDPVCAPLCGVE